MANTTSFDEDGVKKKRSWSKDEDDKLRAYIRRYGHWNWRLLPKFAGLSRSGKSCRLRWVNYLRPDIKHGNFTKEEEDIVVELHKKLGNKWSEMTAYLPGRSDNEIKNRWHTHLKKRVQKDQADMLETEHVRTINPDQDSSKQNPQPVQNSYSEFHQDVEVLLAESPLSSASTNLLPCWFNGLDSACSSDDTPNLTDYTPAGNFWMEPFLSKNDSIISSSDNLFLPSDLVYQTSFKDMIMSDDILWSSQDSYLE